jgi:hypothetical protein
MNQVNSSALPSDDAFEFPETGHPQVDISTPAPGSARDIYERRHPQVEGVPGSIPERRYLQVDSSMFIPSSNSDDRRYLQTIGSPDACIEFLETRHAQDNSIPMPDTLEPQAMLDTQGDNTLVVPSGTPTVLGRRHLQGENSLLVSSSMPEFLGSRYAQVDTSAAMPVSRLDLERVYMQRDMDSLAADSTHHVLERRSPNPEESAASSGTVDVQAQAYHTLQPTSAHASIASTIGPLRHLQNPGDAFQSPRDDSCSEPMLSQRSTGRSNVGTCVWVESEATEQLSEAIANMRAWKLRHASPPVSMRVESPLSLRFTSKHAGASALAT